QLPDRAPPVPEHAPPQPAPRPAPGPGVLPPARPRLHRGLPGRLLRPGPAPPPRRRRPPARRGLRSLVAQHGPGDPPDAIGVGDGVDLGDPAPGDGEAEDG